MKRFLALFFALGLILTAAAQTAITAPEVPHKMQFADLTLTIRDDARREIQKDVDAYTKYPKSFNVKVERARTYFPIIEKVFAEEGVPDDMKFLVIQESALIADAVSVSNAVGFWQFKDFTAIEMGLRVDKEIDERLNIVSASRAAARYLKKNNGYFNNWLFALQAYQMGAGGVLKAEKDAKSAKKNIEITSNTYWYVRKYLAHKIAYEAAVKEGSGQIKVMTYQNKSKKSLDDLAREISVDQTILREYNKWTKSGVIPDDRTYAVVIPFQGDGRNLNLPASDVAVASTAGQNDAQSTPVGETRRGILKINGIQAIMAKAGDKPADVASRGKVELSDFLKWNDMSVSDRIEGGRYYLLGKKRARAQEAYHKVRAGESLWDVSQQYGVRIKKLKRYNRLSGEQIKAGEVLWLASMRPKDSDKAGAIAKTVEVDNSETFAWDASETTATNTAPKPVQSPPTSAKPVQIAPVVSTPVQTPVTTHAPDRVVVNPPKVEAPVSQDVEQTEGAAVNLRETVDSVKTLQRDTVFPTKSDSIHVTVPKTEEVVVPVKKTEHIVQAKETLYGIARQYNVGVMDLVKWNSLDLQQGIRPGQILKLSDGQPVIEEPVATNKPVDVVEHEVKATDTVYSIARKYGVTIKELMDWNNKKDFTLSIGERLKIPNK